MKSTKKTSVREISPGTFRINAVRGRSALTGRYITKATAARHPRTTVAETSTGRSEVTDRRSASG